MKKDQKVRERKLSPKLIAGIMLAMFFAVALILRIYLPYDKVFSGEWIKFTGSDCYYYMRLVDNLVHNFPHLTTFDPYLIYPGGEEVGTIHFFTRLLAGIIWLIGLGSPTQHIIDVIGAYSPAILGALIIIPVYFIGKELVSRWAGIIAAGLAVILPGEFLGRSILGFTDQHVAETLFATTAMLFLILAIKAASQKQLTFSHLKHRDWANSAKPIIYSLLAGIFLGVYLLTWIGALLFVFIISVYFIVQFIIDHLRHKSTDYLCIVGTIIFFIAIIMFLPASSGTLYVTAMLAALLTPLFMNAVSRIMVNTKIKPSYYPLAVVGLGLAGLGIFRIINPSLLSSMLSMFSIAAESSRTTIETQPLLFPTGQLSFQLACGNFPGLIPYNSSAANLSGNNILAFVSSTFFLSVISLIVLAYLSVKQGSAEKSLIAVWSFGMLAFTLLQRRFAYYLAVNVALLTGYLVCLIISRFGFAASTTEAVKSSGGTRGRKARLQNSGFQTTVSLVNMGIAAIIIFLVVFFPNIIPARATASQVQYAPSDAWCSSLDWLRENTPDPFNNPDFYYHIETVRKYKSLSALGGNVTNISEQSYPYPPSAYGVLSWWDYGYWITRIAHRIPNANPGQDPRAIRNVASFFTSQNEESAGKIRQEMGSSYVIIDFDTATGKFWAIATWAGKAPNEYFDLYYVLQENQLVPVQLFYPEYYRSLCTRLYVFDGKAVTPQNPIVISYQERVTSEGTAYKEITSATDNFTSYEEAEAYISARESGNYKIVSTNPLASPVPLEALQHYTLVHSSPNSVTVENMGSVPEVKIFQYID